MTFRVVQEWNHVPDPSPSNHEKCSLSAKRRLLLDLVATPCITSVLLQEQISTYRQYFVIYNRLREPRRVLINNIEHLPCEVLSSTCIPSALLYAFSWAGWSLATCALLTWGLYGVYCTNSRATCFPVPEQCRKRYSAKVQSKRDLGVKCSNQPMMVSPFR